MTTMISELFDALRSGNVPEDKARAAAEAVAAMPEARLTAIEGRLDHMGRRLDHVGRRLGRLEIQFAVLAVLITGLYALGGWAMTVLLHVAAKVGALG